jgi:hypothetical protein
LAAPGTQVRWARLTGNEPGELLVFDVWGKEGLTALNADGSKLWQKSRGDGIDDVWATDLDGDGKHEVIVGYNGSTGLHVFEADGKPHWKETSIGNVWHVTAGDVEGDGDVEVVTTSATGKVHVFDATGKSIATLDPGIYATMVRLFRVRGEKADSLLVIGGGPKDAKMVAINAKGQRLWQSDLPPDIKTCASLAVAPKSSWAAAGSMGSDVWVVDTVTGKIIGRHRSQGSPDVAWCAGDNEDPLLLVASTSGLTAWRVTPTVDSGDEE